MTNENATDVLEGRTPFSLSIPDLDARLRLKIRTIVNTAIPVVYAEFARHIDVASLRRRGIVSVISHAEFGTEAVPLPIGGEVDIRTSIRLCDFAAGTLGEKRKRFGFEVRLELHARPGTGDPLRYREPAPDAESVVCGTGTILLAMLRPAAPLAERLLAEAPPEVAALVVHPLRVPHPSNESLLEAPSGFESCGGDARTPIVWGLHNSDVNQNVFAGEYISTLEDAFSRALHSGAQNVAAHHIERASLLFKRPFTAGSPASLDARALVRGARTLLLGGFHGFGDGGAVSPQPSIVGRVEGRIRDIRE